MSKVTLKLKKPIMVGEGEPITELSFRDEVCAGDMRGLAMRDPMHWDDILKIAGRLCGQTDVVMNKLSFADTAKVVEMTGNFMSAGLETGQT